jgi:hypothetical protein
MKVYKTRWFSRWAKSESVSDKALLNAMSEMTNGLVGSDLGGSVFKKRVALPGRGKSGGSRTLVAYNKGDAIFFIYGFAKNDKENIHIKELQTLKLLASDLLKYTESHLKVLVTNKELVEIINE